MPFPPSNILPWKPSKYIPGRCHSLPVYKMYIGILYNYICAKCIFMNFSKIKKILKIFKKVLTFRKFHDIIHIEDKTRTAERQGGI